MHHIVQLFGAVVALAGIVVIAFSVMLFVNIDQPGDVIAALSFAAGGLSAVVSGALLYCFGAIVEHLIAIRRALEIKPS